MMISNFKKNFRIEVGINYEDLLIINFYILHKLKGHK